MDKQSQELCDLIIADVKRLPARHDKDRVYEIVGEMFSKYAGELEFFGAISAISRSLSAMQRKEKIKYP